MWKQVGSIVIVLILSIGIGGLDRGEALTSGSATDVEPDVNEPAARDLDAGRALFADICSSCHGRKGHGVENRGVPLRTSEFVRAQSDDALVRFVKRGRSRTDPASKTDARMPARGDNPVLADDGVYDIVAFLRVLQQEAAAEGEQMPDPVPVAGR